MNDKVIGYFLSVFSLAIVVFELFSLISALTDSKRSNFSKALDTVIHVGGVWAFRPDLSDAELSNMNYIVTNNGMNVNNYQLSFFNFKY